METFFYNISQVLGITLIHSLWQGLLIYFMLKLALMCSVRLTASARYLLALTSLFAITGWFLYTLIDEIHIYNWLAASTELLNPMPVILNLPPGIHEFKDQGIRYYYSIEGYLPYITLLYTAGIFFNTGRMILGRHKINTIRRSMSIDMQIQRTVNQFAEMLNIDHRVKIGLSNLVDVPCMVGYF